jgi:hypothetical protein
MTHKPRPISCYDLKPLHPVSWFEKVSKSLFSREEPRRYSTLQKIKKNSSKMDRLIPCSHSLDRDSDIVQRKRAEIHPRRIYQSPISYHDAVLIGTAFIKGLKVSQFGDDEDEQLIPQRIVMYDGIGIDAQTL